MPDLLASSDRITPEAPPQSAFTSGALLPKDMSVTLVRADTATLENILAIIYSITLGLFGVFLGAGMAESQTKFTALEQAATWVFGIASLGLAGGLIYLKIRQSRASVRVPYETLCRLPSANESAES